MADFDPSNGIPALQSHNEELDTNLSTIGQFNLLLDGETIDQFWGDSNNVSEEDNSYSDSYCKSNGGNFPEILIEQELDQTISKEDENPPKLILANPKKKFVTMLFPRIRRTLASLFMTEKDFLMLTFLRVFGNTLARNPTKFLCPPYVWKRKDKEVYRDMYFWLKLTNEEKKDRLEEFEERQFRLYNLEKIHQNVAKTCYQLSLSVKYVCYQVGKGKVEQLRSWRQFPNGGDRHFFKRLFNWLRLSDDEKVRQGGERRVTGKAKRVIDRHFKENPDISREELGQIADELEIPQIVIFSYAKLTGLL